MDFEKKLKARHNIMLIYMAAGVLLIALNLLKISENEYLMTFGVALTVLGFLKTLQYKRITKDEESIHRRMVLESDERNIAIMHKAKSAAFGWYVIIACLAVIVLSVMGEKDYSRFIAFTVCTLVFLYWISYFVYSRKS